MVITMSEDIAINVELIPIVKGVNVSVIMILIGLEQILDL